MTFLRTTRPKTVPLYENTEEFPIGGSKTLRTSDADRATLVAAGITVHESLKAAEELTKEGIRVRVIDVYSIKPIDEETLRKAAKETGVIVTVEDHSIHGGLGDAVASVVPVIKLGVREIARSGKAAELMAWAGIDAAAIAETVRKNV